MNSSKTSSKKKKENTLHNTAMLVCTSIHVKRRLGNFPCESSIPGLRIGWSSLAPVRDPMEHSSSSVRDGQWRFFGARFWEKK
jgi:hypothetical protein